jgi:FkbM family methyltransferase
MSRIRQFAKAVLPPAATIRLRATFKRHENERKLLPALCDPARAGVDVGAALGAYTWPLSRLCKSCTAFEPNPLQAAYLRRAFGNTVRIENVALSNISGEIELVIPLDNGRDMAGLASISPGEIFSGRAVRRQKVAMRTLDSFALGPTGFMKVDVEGHELAVLEGATDLLRRDQPIVLVELEERFASGSVARVCTFLEQMGYRGLFLEQQVLKPVMAFDALRHQAMENWGTIGAYINNFIFLPQQTFAATLGRLVRLGYRSDGDEGN